MIITLVGMSNIGKSRLAERLVADKGFERIGCDDLVETAIGDELKQLGYSGVNDVGRWMGQPYTPNYPRNSAKFIECEREVMLQVISRIETTKVEYPLVIDTTGSVIYVGDDVINNLKKLTKIVYLEASEAHREQLFKLYMEEPKPVIWGDSYSKLPSESEHESLVRCYPKLLGFRASKFEAVANLIIPYESHRINEMDLEALLSVI
jgi:shikimate kinase